MIITTSQMLQNLKEHWRKYVIFSIFIYFILNWSIHKLQDAANRATLTAESFLHLTPRNVPRLPSSKIGKVPNDLSSLQKTLPYIPPESKVTEISSQPNSLLSPSRTKTIKFDEWGFTHEIGLELEPFPIGVGLDFKWFYISRLGTNLGLNLVQANSRNYVTPSLSLSYHLDRIPFLTSSEILLGYSPLGPLPAYLALRLTFGR